MKIFDCLRCDHCKKGGLTPIEAVEPYSTRHYMCVECDSTYCDFVIEEKIVEAVLEKINKKGLKVMKNQYKCNCHYDWEEVSTDEILKD